MKHAFYALNQEKSYIGVVAKSDRKLLPSSQKHIFTLHLNTSFNLEKQIKIRFSLPKHSVSSSFYQQSWKETNIRVLQNMTPFRTVKHSTCKYKHIYTWYVILK
jgi:galactose mutarotase-like enzyme